MRAVHAIIVLMSLSATFAAAEDPATECADLREAITRGWEVIAGEAPRGQGPELSVVTDAAVGTTALRVEAKAAGDWQGLVLNKAVDLSKFARMEFFVKQNVRVEPPPSVLAVQVFFADAGVAVADPVLGLGEQWTKVSLPLRTPPWTITDRPQTLGITDRIRFYPYRELNSPGEYLQIDGLTFIPLEEDATMQTQGITYRYDVGPAEGTDPKQTELLDGDNAPDQQVTFAPYSGDPVIVFDLSETQTLTRVVLKAYPKGGRNIAAATVEVSEDGKAWTPAASLTNEQSPAAGAEQVLAVTCLGVGRYVRLTLRKPQVDVPQTLGEVVLERRATTPADREYKPEAYFEGPTLPPIPETRAENAAYLWLRGKTTSVAIHRPTGVIAGIWTADGKQVVLRGWDRYVFENRDALVESAEYADGGEMTRKQADLLTWKGRNGDVGDITIEKTYRLRRVGSEEALEKRTQLIYTGPRDDQFGTVLSNIALDEAFRRGGYYEGVQNRCARTLADDVRFKQITPPNKALMLSHPQTGETITQYRFEVNDRFCMPYYTQPAAETYCATSYNRNGWEIGQVTLKLAPNRPQSVQVNTLLLGVAGFQPAGRFGWERHFVSLPEYRQFVTGIQRPAWIRDTKAVFQDSYYELIPGRPKRNADRLLSIIDDGYLLTPGYGHCDGAMGDLPISGDCYDFFGGRTPTDEVERMLRDVQRNPRLKAGLYMWLQSATFDSEVYREHPDWFIATNKAGDPLSFFPTLKTNFSRILGAPGHEDFLVKQVMDFLKRYPNADWYLDGGAGVANMIDWKTLQISHDYQGEDFCRRVRTEFTRHNPQGITFFNDAEDRFGDIGYAEIGTGFGQDWRTSAAGLYQTKVRQYFDPQRLLSPLYITRANSLPYLRLCAGLGLIPSDTISYETADLLQYAPHLSASFETRGLQFSPTGISPDWRADADTPVEMYAVRAGSGLVLSVVSHAETELAQELRAQVPADLARPGETVYVAHHVLKDMLQFPAPISDFAAKATYRRDGWAAGAVTEWRSITPVVVDRDGWISLKATLPPGLLNLFSVVRTPAYYWSRDGLRANFLLPGVRGRHLAAQAAEGPVKVTAPAEDVPVEVLVLAPPGQRLAIPKGCRPVMLHGLYGAIIPVAPAKTPSVFSLAMGAAETAAPRWELTAPPTIAAGQDLSLGVPVATGMYCNIWRDGTLVWAGMAGTVRVPVEAQDGMYRLEAGRTPSTMAEATFTVTGHQQTEQIAPYWPPMQPTSEVTPATGERDGVKLLSAGKAVHAGGEVLVDTDTLTLRAAIPDKAQSYYNQALAGLELQGLRSAMIRVDHNMVPQRGLYPARHVLLEESPNAFIGFFVDYGTAAGYSHRAAFSLGQMSVKRDSALPGWGACKPPERFLRLPETIFTGEKVEGRVDFAPYAPPDWDGRVWITLAFENVFRSRWLSLQLVQVNPPAEAPAVKVQDVLAAASQPRDRSVRAPRFAAAPQLDGKLDDEVWQQAQPVGDFSIVEKLGDPASQQTEVRMGYDDRFIYLAFTCLESEKKGFTISGGAAGTPWWDDSIEFSLLPASWGGKYFHAIATADAVTYQEIADGTGRSEKSALALQAHAHRETGQFTVEVAVPLGEGGLPAPQTAEQWRAQFMRTRVNPDGTREFDTWTMSDGYHDAKAFGKLSFD